MNSEFLKTLECPMTGQRFVDPVIFASTGVTYEREAIQKWIDDHGGDFNYVLIPNKPIHDIIDALANV